MSRLEEIHGELEDHFRALRAMREAQGEPKPLFALEHGLEPEAVDELSSVVREAVRSIGLSPSAWLPYVIYAAEVGYRYTGEEYWQTFERTTPGFWGDNYRQWLRRRFRKFADEYGGARPAGPWAAHFSIIAWPITHAVLPTDLQLQLAHLLYDYRLSLTRDLLADPDALGSWLAERSWSGSSRFQVFAENESLLGQVASALLLGESEQAELLYPATLRRIVSDLSAERHARRWLRDAARSANRIRVLGMPARDPSRQAAPRERTRSVSPPDLFLVRGEGERWNLWVELPDLTPATGVDAELREALTRRRCVVAGVEGSPLAPRRVMFPAQHIRLSNWPGWGAALLRIENGDPADNAKLATLVRLPEGPVIVFQLTAGTAHELRGRGVRPGNEYILVTAGGLPDPSPSWVQAESLSLNGLVAYRMSVPGTVDSADENWIVSVGLSLRTDVLVAAAGVVPRAWREDAIEYVAGDSPLLSISSTRRLDYAVIAVGDEVPRRLEWPGEEDRVFVSLPPLPVGEHSVSMTVVPTGEQPRVLDDVVRISVREPTPRQVSGDFREPLLLLSYPLRPTLEEIWSGDVSIEILGPPGVPIRGQMVLRGVDEAVLLRRQVQGLKTPTSTVDWERTFERQVRSVSQVSEKFDEALSASIEIAHPELGHVSLKAERAFVPLRWAFTRQDGQICARLYDNLGETISVCRYDFARPDIPIPLTEDQLPLVVTSDGGLVSASAGDVEAAAIVPPEVRSIEDLRRVRTTPVIGSPSRTAAGIEGLIRLAELWASASLPGNPIAALLRGDVLDAIHASIASTVCGPNWSTAAQSAASLEGQEAVRVLASGIGQQQQHRALVTPLTRLAEEFPAVDLGERVSLFSDFLRQHAGVFGTTPDELLAEGLLRLASRPETMAGKSHLYADAVTKSLETPLLLRAGRFVVLSTDLFTQQAAVGTHGGWDWW